jgi:hypothetical protein
MALHPSPERLLARLIYIVPELAELGETERLVGNPARAIIDHEDESAGQQQQPYKSKNTADHASPYIYLSCLGAVPNEQERKRRWFFVSTRFGREGCPLRWKTLQAAASHYRVHSGNSTSSVTYRHFAAGLPALEDAGKR